MKHLIAFTIICACFTLRGQADTPSEFLTKYFESLKAKGYAGTIGMFHPDAVTTFSGMVRGGLTADVEEKGKESRLAAFADPSDPHKLAPMNDADLTKTFFKWMEDRNPGFKEMNLNQRAKIIGSVHEEDTNTEHVVVRITIDSPTRGRMDEVEVFSMRKNESGEWGMLLSKDWIDIGNAFKSP